MDGLEIERVWVLRRVPELPMSQERLEIEQGYLPDASNAAPPEFAEGRIRRARRDDGTAICTHTIKRGSGLVRRELERQIAEEEFERLWPLTARRRIAKRRTRIREGGLVWEIDQFRVLPLVMAEVELPSPDTLPRIPLWLAREISREVTDDPRYRNAALAIDGMPIEVDTGA